MPVIDSRRLTGPGLFLDGPGAVLDVTIEPGLRDRAVAAWRKALAELLEAVGWQGQTVAVRGFKEGVSLAFSAPADCLYAATTLNEMAWAAAEAETNGAVPPADDLAALRQAIAAERNPRLLALREAARQRGVTFLAGEDLVSVGSGESVVCWPMEAIPSPDAVDWSRVHDVPIALVTGSNGKTTVVRLLGAILTAASRTPGITSTDGVSVGMSFLVEGDFSGPSGARMVLRDNRVEAAVLETARGGILRRGLAVDRADVAVVTNIAKDHLGEFGVDSVADLAETKLVVARALSQSGTLVLNADDPELVARSGRIPAAISWFSLSNDSEVVSRSLAGGGTAVVVDGDEIVVARGKSRTRLMRASDIPITFGGSARHNVANVLAATAAGIALGIDLRHIETALCQFGQFPGDNPGRTNVLELGGVTVLLDFAHNPHGMAALVDVARTLPARRRLVLVGQAGDRDDEAIRDLARAAWELRPDHFVVKELDHYLRGRAPGEVPRILADEFARLGAPKNAISDGGPELEGVRSALSWARPGDLLVLAVHQDRRAVMGLLSRLTTTGWHAGDPLPA